jgi:hypothetical protein
MKHTLITALALIVLVSCTEKEMDYTVNPELSTYVDAFYSDASAADKDVPKVLIADIKPIQSITYSESGDQPLFYFNTQSFQDMSDEARRTHSYLALGKALLRANVNPYIENEAGQVTGVKSFDQIKAEIFN